MIDASLEHAYARLEQAVQANADKPYSRREHVVAAMLDTAPEGTALFCAHFQKALEFNRTGQDHGPVTQLDYERELFRIYRNYLYHTNFQPMNAINSYDSGSYAYWNSAK